MKYWQAALQQNNMSKQHSKDIICSFCGSSKQDTLMLIAGLDAHICDKCVTQASQIVSEESAVRSKKSTQSAINLLKQIGRAHV